MRRRYTNSEPVKWRVDPDGLMRITMCILKTGVYDYGPEEVPDDPSLSGKSVIREYIPAEEFAKPEALLTLEGKPIVITEHEWRDAENTLVDGFTVGAVAGAPYVEGDELLVDALIYDTETQGAIQSGELVEVSAAYDGDIIVGGGDYNGEQFDATQSNFRFNHVLLLPKGQGRCGYDVRIINQKPEGVVMADKTATLRVRIGNKDRTFRFTNEEDRAEAESMLEEQKSFNAEELQRSIEERDELKKKIDELSAQLAQHDENLKAARDELAAMLEPAAQEALAEEALAQREDEDAVIEDEVETALEGEELENEDAIEERMEEEKERISNSIRKGTFADRRRNAVSLVFANQKRELPANWSQDAVDGAFETIVMQARQRNAARKEETKTGKTQMVLNGRKTPGVEQRSNNTARDRMLRPMRVKNGKEEK